MQNSRRKRDVFLDVVRRPRAGSHHLHTTTAEKTSRRASSDAQQSTTQGLSLDSTATSSAINGNLTTNFLQAALQKLTAQQQRTITEHLGTSTSFDSILDAVLKQKETCERKRWHVEISGHTIVLRDVAEKIIKWLNNFKAAGSAIAELDPVHLQLPWLGIRMLLEVLVGDVNHMATLLSGMDLALAIAQRLEVYIGYHDNLPDHITKTNLRIALVNLYAKLLTFLSAAIETYRQNTALRIVAAVWRGEEFAQVEQDFDRLGSRAEIEASNCDRHIHSEHWITLQQRFQELDNIATIKTSVEELHTKVDLSKLITAKGATYDAHDEEHAAYCLNGTREEILQTVWDWSRDRKDKNIFWLCGMAGTGKSTIARSVAEKLDQDGTLAASFFFKRGEGDRGNGGYFFPTIAKQFSDHVPGMDMAIARALKEDSFICERSLQKQFERLLLGPLVNCCYQTKQLFIVVDALDECGNGAHVPMILNLLLKTTAVRLRVLVTSRPEVPIAHGFQKIDRSLHRDIKLEVVQVPSIRGDLEVYIKHELELMRQDYTDEYQLADDWPGESSMQKLVDLANPLFIFAFTTCRYISESNPRTRLASILDQSIGASLSGIDKTYLPILNNLLDNFQAFEHERIIKHFRQIVGSIVLLADPLPLSALSRLLDITLDDIHEILRHLRSVLSVPPDNDTPVRILHLSFRDFLVDPNKRQLHRLWIDEHELHAFLAKQCVLRLGQDGILHEDVMNVTPGTLRSEVNIMIVERHLTKDVAYACINWIWHVNQTDCKLEDDGYVWHFLQIHFLHWLEALSWLGQIEKSKINLSTILHLANQSSQLGTFIEDATRFMLKYQHLINEYPLQLYHSAVSFAPTSSVVKAMFEKEVNTLLMVHATVPASNWGAQISSLPKDRSSVHSMAFSAATQAIVVGDQEGVVTVSHNTTREQVWTHQAHSNAIKAVAITNDGRFIASTAGNIVYVFKASTAEIINTLADCGEDPDTVVFSGSGSIIAVSARDQIAIWDAQSGRKLITYQFENDAPYVFALSPDCSHIAAATFRNDVKVWQTTKLTARYVSYEQSLLSKVAEVSDVTHAMSLGMDSRQVTTLAYSSDGSLLAFGAVAITIILDNRSAKANYDTSDSNSSGLTRLSLIGHKSSIKAMTFSPDGLYLASGSSDRNVRLWDVKSRQCLYLYEGHRASVTALAFINQQLASASLDGTVRFWDCVGSTAEITASTDDNSFVSGTFSADGSIFVIQITKYPNSRSTADSTVPITIYDTTTGGVQSRILIKGSTQLSISPNGTFIAAILENQQSVSTWQSKTGLKIWEFQTGTSHHINALANSSDASLCILALSSNFLSLYAICEDRKSYSPWTERAYEVSGESSNKGYPLWTVAGEDVKEITILAFSPDGHSIVSGNPHVGLRIWSTTTGQHLHTILCWGTPTQLRFSPAGNHLIAYMREGRGKARIWALEESHSDLLEQEKELEDNWSWDRGSILYRKERLLTAPDDYEYATMLHHRDILVAIKNYSAMIFVRMLKPAELRQQVTVDATKAAEKDGMEPAISSLEKTWSF